MTDDYCEYTKILNILKSIDPCTTEILARVEKASIYTFCGMKNEWKDNGIEGEFFVCSRSKEPFSCIHILNHEKKQNLMEPILEDWDWKTQESLLLFRKGQTICGIRFFSNEDYSKICDLLTNIVDTLKCKPKEVLTAPVIVKMLCEAQEDFQKVANLIQGQLLEAQQKQQPQPHNSFISTDKSAGTEGDPNLKTNASSSSMIDMEDLENLASMLSLLEQNTSKPSSNILQTQNEIPNNHFEKPDPLSRKQMIFALIYLLKNDNDFVMKLYKAYIKSFMEML